VTGFPVANVRYLIHISLKKVRAVLREQLEQMPPAFKETLQ